MSESRIEQLDEQADQLDLSRSQFIREALKAACRHPGIVTGDSDAIADAEQDGLGSDDERLEQELEEVKAEVSELAAILDVVDSTTRDTQTQLEEFVSMIQHQSQKSGVPNRDDHDSLGDAGSSRGSDQEETGEEDDEAYGGENEDLNDIF
jgi:hypothetical protein